MFQLLLLYTPKLPLYEEYYSCPSVACFETNPSQKSPWHMSTAGNETTSRYSNHEPQSVSDWLKPHFLGMMFTFAYIENCLELNMFN